MSFVPDNMITALGSMTRDQADSADYGIVKVDDAGKILLYNRYESELAGIAPWAAEGRNFFTEIAPCTNNKLVFGRFKSGVESGSLDASFNYTFTYKMRPTNVKIRMIRDAASSTNWVFVRKA